MLAYNEGVDNSNGFINLAGIRFDEADREGIKFQYDMENENRAAYPYIDLKITKSMVFDILDKSVGIPSTYNTRSRSGCFLCFFQRIQEIIGMLVSSPKDFAKTESLEKLTEADQQRWEAAETLRDIGFRGHYPVPAFVDLRKRSANTLPSPEPKKAKAKKDKATEDMFAFDDVQEAQSLYVAFALYTNDMLGWFGGREFTPGVYHQDLVTVSTSLPGLKSSLGNYYKFKMTTPMATTDVKDMKIVIAKVDFSNGEIDLGAPDSKSFTWKKGTSYKQIRHMATHCIAALEQADLKRRLNDAEHLMGTTEDEDVFVGAAEEAETVEMLLAKHKATGSVVWEGLYTPSKEVNEIVQLQLDGVSVETERKKAREGIEFDEVPMSCLACSL